jgi:hypothetical protein
VRDALRRIEDQEAREVRLAQPTAEDIVSSLTDDQIQLVRDRVRAGIEEIAQGEFTDYVGREGLTELATTIKTRGREAIAKRKRESSR